ncbi:YqiA/YcfP family alpha/beta fold hydrolase [Macromonas nakdongensis]|uniref:YqiA/YcfP family alpha/beta fold hydrolase n=1 Tax=Macromonas nakdongensis TaxID=1843082 RepID=UPI000C32AFB8|nr:YqiA/YcfP family alpha/beta fold hydrolase [Macromonas nakdongensis]
MTPPPNTTTVHTTHLLYLHGFRSSPRSTKAVRMAARVRRAHPGVTWWCPQLPPSPAAAMALIRQGSADWPRDRMAVVGSSLGGFYATRLALETGCRAVLLNPAVDPARDLAKYIGEQTAWHDPEERFFFRPEYVDELRALAGGALPQPERVYAVVAQGDEVLDWREMVGRYPGVHLKLLAGSDHALSDFDDHIDEVVAHLRLA